MVLNVFLSVHNLNFYHTFACHLYPNGLSGHCLNSQVLVISTHMFTTRYNQILLTPCVLSPSSNQDDQDGQNDQEDQNVKNYQGGDRNKWIKH